jgi:hypothetical protein
MPLIANFRKEKKERKREEISACVHQRADVNSGEINRG